MTDLTGQLIDQRYEIVELLDEGGMAMVYRAHDARLDRMVALKIITKEKFNKEQLEEILRRFEQEARALAQLSHPNIVPILDYGKHEGSPYLVLEYLSGGTLKRKMDPPLPWQVAVSLMVPIMDALTYCHQHHILHRDIKPSNILFKEDDTPVLTDFGIAKLLETVNASAKTGSGELVGTPGYMAPEQHNNNHTKLDARTDVYQLGIVLYEVITGHRPSDLATIVETIPKPKDYVENLPGELDKILLKALAFKPKERYQTVEEFKAALQNVLQQQPFPSDTEKNLPQKKSRKRPDNNDSSQPTRPLRVFLSCAKADDGHVTGLASALHQDGMRIRPDKRNSNPGENFLDKLSRDIQKSDTLIVCLTRNSVGRSSTLHPEIKHALEKAHEASILIIPVRLHECKIPQELSTIKHVDLFDAVGYQNLRNVLAARAKQVNAAPPLTATVYVPPRIHENHGTRVKYFSVAALICIVFAAIIAYRQFGNNFLPLTPAVNFTPTSTLPATTEPPASPASANNPELTIYPSEITDRRGTAMVFVKMENFAMGYKAEETLAECKKYSRNCSLNQFIGAEPAAEVSLGPYYIDKYEVSNSAYQKCVEAQVCKPPKETGSYTRAKYYGLKEFAPYPVIYVDWDMAKTYCEEWRDARLPTEAEWEKAARGTGNYLFPWGNVFDDENVNFCDKNCPFGLANRNLEDGYSDTAPVNEFPGGVSIYGVFNMAGNVWEWINSLYKPYPYIPDDGRENLLDPGIRVVRGGSWRDDVSSLFSITRNGYRSTSANETIGFRCAKTP